MSKVLVNPGSEPITPGSNVELLAKFTDSTSAEEPLEPPTVTLTIRAPDGSESTPIAIKVKAGEWNYVFEPEQPGRWYFRFDGDTVAAVEGTFVIAESKV